jgi:mannose-6-phosphate isomerase-like protein (cupin superfamily)
VSHPSSDGEVSAILRPIASIEPLLVGTTNARFIAPGSVTNGHFGLFRWDMSGQTGGATAHYHRTFSESFYVLSGSVSLFDGAAWVGATAGDFLFVPERGIHGFRNESGEPASMLILFSPGPPREEYLKELAEIRASGRELTSDQWTDLYARHDQYMVE